MIFDFSCDCQVLPPSDHTVKSAASKFLLEWLLQHEHEHRQWSAAISLGLISCCLHVTDHKQRYHNITGLLEVLLFFLIDRLCLVVSYEDLEPSFLFLCCPFFFRFLIYVIIFWFFFRSQNTFDVIFNIILFLN